MGELILKKNAAGQSFHVQLVNRSDGTDMTSGTPTVQVSKDGGNYANIGGSISHKADGSWDVALNAADTNFDRGAYKVTLTNALTVTLNAVTEPSVNVTAWQDAALSGDNMVEDDGSGNSRWTRKALEQTPIGSGNAYKLSYNWSIQTTATNPGATFVKADSTTYSSITEIYINDLDRNQENQGATFSQMKQGDDIEIELDADNYIYLTIDGAPTDNTDWWTFPVSHNESKGTIPNANPVDVTFYETQADLSAIAGAVWDKARSGHTTAGSFGEALDEQVSTVNNNVLALRVNKNTALNNFKFGMTDDINHEPATGLTVTAQRSIDGGAFAACVNTPIEISNGAYKINLVASDLNGDVIMLRFTAIGADDVLLTIITQP